MMKRCLLGLCVGLGMGWATQAVADHWAVQADEMSAHYILSNKNQSLHIFCTPTQDHAMVLMDNGNSLTLMPSQALYHLKLDDKPFAIPANSATFDNADSWELMVFGLSRAKTVSVIQEGQVVAHFTPTHRSLKKASALATCAPILYGNHAII